MNINKKIGIIIAILTFTLALFVLPWYGLSIVSIVPYLYFGLLIAVGYIIIDTLSKFANRLFDALGKRQAVGNDEINAKIELMMQRMQVIEHKVDKTNEILENVSE